MQSGVSRLARGAGSGWIFGMAIIGSFAAVRAQTPPSTSIATAFSYIEDLCREDSPARARLRAIAVGSSQRIELGGGVFALEQVYASKARADGFFESHRKYIDVQVVVEGEELLEVVDAARIAVKAPFNAERDLVLYDDTTAATQVRLQAGEAAVFFPVDVHMPALRPGPTPGIVRKAVVKVPTAAA